MSQGSQEGGDTAKHVLLFLDDDLSMLALYKAYFQCSGYSVIACSQGVHAIQFAKANRVRVAVVDYDMPEMNGHDAALALKRACPSLKVVMVSGNDGLPQEAMQAVDFFVPKSSGQHQLRKVIEAFVGV